MAMFGIMIIHAYTDKKTKTVYRPFNYCLWIIGGIYAILKLFIFKDLIVADGNAIFTIIYILIFIFSMYLFTFVFKATGKGDGYMMIGLSLFIPFLSKDTPFFSLIIMLLYYVCAGIFQIISNIKKMEFKKFRFKEKLAFAPALLYGLWIILILSFIFTKPFFQTWQMNLFL